MIYMQFCGQWGNQLFQYVIAKIVAERTGLAYAPPDTFYAKNGDPVRWTGEPLVTMQPTPGRVMQAHRDGWQRVNAIHWADLDAIDSERPVFMTGFFQRYELVKPWKEKIRTQWLAISPDRFIATDPDAVYVHVRRTDYVPGQDNPNNYRIHCLAATMDEYARGLAEFPDAKRLVLVTDDPGDAFLQEFSRFGLPCEVSGKRWDEDFLLLASARNLLICQSTFSWWAGWLGRAERIACCVPEGTYWRMGLNAIGSDRPEHPNLYPDDEPHRWKWITE